MKTPLRIDKSTTGESCVIIDLEGNEIAIAWTKHAEPLVALANAHTAQPGAPREDGVWDVLTESGVEYIVERHQGVYRIGQCNCFLSERAIVAHRKHTPLEVPKCD